LNNYERGFIRYSTNILQIGHEAGGTGNASRVISIRTAGAESVYIDASGLYPVNAFGIKSKLYCSSPSDGVLTLNDWNSTGAIRVQFGGTTSSFPAIKRSSTVLQSRLADDSAFCPLQGKLRTDTNATTGLMAGVLAATTNATIDLYDASGQLYRVPCII
jgi:hypothetical protein